MHAEVLRRGAGLVRVSSAPINPPADYGWGWWLALFAAVMVTGLLWWRAIRVVRATRAVGEGDSVDMLRAQTLAALDHVRDAARAGRIHERQAGLAMSSQVRRFVGIVADSDADYTTLPELRRAAVKDPRLEAVAGFVAALEPALFDGVTHLDLSRAHQQACDVVRQWR